MQGNWTETHLWVKLGEKYTGKGLEGIGPAGQMGDEGLGHMAPCQGMRHACTAR